MMWWDRLVMEQTATVIDRRYSFRCQMGNERSEMDGAKRRRCQTGMSDSLLRGGCSGLLDELFAGGVWWLGMESERMVRFSHERGAFLKGRAWVPEGYP